MLAEPPNRIFRLFLWGGKDISLDDLLTLRAAK
jgi:hypothetical protein